MALVMEDTKYVTMIKPHCLYPRSVEESVPSTMCELFDVSFYSNFEEAWNFAENNEIGLLITLFDRTQTGFKALLNGMKVMHPDLIHLLVADDITAEELIAVVNVSARIRVINSQDLERELSKAGADCYSLYLSGSRKDRHILALTEENQNYESLLREHYLS
ncbi:hypothetical protein [Sanyastnella coralliicola]|uniref:hypothetical protein n=1 Tax=Sanyastnella coralliicola TaxID=3069118 RepID=UPI0027B96F57|nr:hypothetical protein [Longitalea sp. SCSIO 12813]